jgi:hypothetical protein
MHQFSHTSYTYCMVKFIKTWSSQSLGRRENI